MKTVSLETAKQLKEVGFPQETEFYWRVPDDEEKSTVESREKMKKFYYIFPTYASPTADEILDELPTQLKTKEFLSILKFNTYWVGYGEGTKTYIHFDSEGLAEACAEMYLYLKKEGLI